MWKGGGVVFGDGGIGLNNLNSIILALWNVFRLGEIQFRLGEIQKQIYKSHRVNLGGGGAGPQ